ESVWTSMRLGSSFTSRSFEKERRSRDARRANVTPIAEGFKLRCGFGNRPARRATGGDARRPGQSGARRQEPGSSETPNGQTRVRRPSPFAMPAANYRARAPPASRGRRPDVRCRISPKPVGGNDFPTEFPADESFRLLELDLGAGLFELRLRLFGVFLRGLLEDGLGGTVDEVLGLLQ